MRRRLARLVWVWLALPGCAALGGGESQLLGPQSRFDSAAVTYVVEPAEATQQPSRHSDVSLASYQSAASRPRAAHGRTTLAIRYPHPAGRRGYARVEVVVETAPGARNATSPGWLDRVRRFADENLPGLALADGVEQALALDLPIADLGRLMNQLQQPPSSTDAAPDVSVSFSASINGQQLPARISRAAELDALVLRVRREGSLISQRQIPAPEPASELRPRPDQPFPPSQVVRASSTAPALERLPPIIDDR